MVERPKQSKLKEIQSEVEEAFITAFPLLALLFAFGLVYSVNEEANKEAGVDRSPSGKAIVIPAASESRYGICFSTLDQIQRFYEESEGTIVSVEEIPLPRKGDLKFELWDRWQREKRDGKIVFGGLVDSHGLLDLVGNLPSGLVTEALVLVNFEVNFEEGQDVLLQGEIDEKEVCLKPVGLVTDLNQPKIPTWAKIEKDGYSVWNPEKGQWESSF